MLWASYCRPPPLKWRTFSTMLRILPSQVNATSIHFYPPHAFLSCTRPSYVVLVAHHYYLMNEWTRCPSMPDGYARTCSEGASVLHLWLKKSLGGCACSIWLPLTQFCPFEIFQPCEREDVGLFQISESSHWFSTVDHNKPWEKDALCIIVLT